MKSEPGTQQALSSSPSPPTRRRTLEWRDTTILFLLLALSASLSLHHLSSSPPPNARPPPGLVDSNPNSIPGGPQLPPNVGRLPFMGYNTWNAYHCHINQTVVLENAELMVKLGFRDLGYTYLNIDDCYSEKKRNAKGEIVANSTRFPDGMKSVVDRIHALGLKAGIYSDSGWFTCQMYPGSYMNEEQDVRTFQGDWGFDLLKFDNCAVPFDSIIKEGMIGKFSRMANAIVNVAKELGKEPMLFSLCQWGRNEPWLWARHFGQSWRATNDINEKWESISSIIHQAMRFSWASDFYGHNDLDILEVGNIRGLTLDESKTHFTAWALMKSPLLIGADLRKLTEKDIEVYSNRDIIQINQDPVFGKGITPFTWGRDYYDQPEDINPAEYWSMQSENGTVFMLINFSSHPKNMSFSFVESPWGRAGALYSIYDLWTHTDNGTHYRNFTTSGPVPSHGVVALLAKDVGDEPVGVEPPCAIKEWCTGEDGRIVWPDWGSP